MISLNTKSSNEFRQLNETVPELFRLSAKVQLAETISFLNPIPEDSAQILISSCLSLLPAGRRYLDVTLNDAQLQSTVNANPTVSTSLVSIRSQESVIALSHLYKCSNGVINPDDVNVVSLLTSFMYYLTYTDFATASPSDADHATNFTCYLIEQLSILSHVTTDARRIIVPAFLDFFQHIVNTMTNPSLIYGALRAMGSNHRFNYQQDELERVIVSIEYLLNQLQCSSNQPNPKASTTSTSLAKFNVKKCLLLICRAYEQMTSLPQEQVDSDTYKKLYNNVLPYTSTSNIHYFADNETFISIINVMVSCAIHDASIGKDVLEFITRYITDSKNYSSEEVLSALQRQHTENLHSTVLSSLVKLTDKYPDKVTRVIDVLKDFISNSLVPKHSEAIRLAAFDTICKILKNEQMKEQVDICRQVIASFVNTLQTHYYNYTSGQMVSQQGMAESQLPRSPSSVNIQSDALSNIIRCLGRITCSLNDPTITDLIREQLISMVTYPPSNVENLILEQLTDIALLGHESITKDIVVLITNLFKKIYKDPNQVFITNITPIALQRLAKDLTHPELRQDLCMSVLKLFQQLGKTIKREDLEQNISSPILKGMGFLLPTIAELVKQPVAAGVNPSAVSTGLRFDTINSGNIKLFRSVWFYCVMFKFSVPGTWRTDWLECVQVIAAHLHPLISTKTHLYLEIILELESIIKQGFEKEYFVQLRTTLNECLPGVNVIRNLTFAQMAYVYAVHTLETMRFHESHSFKVIFSYLEDQGIDNSNVSTCIRGIADRVFAEFLAIFSPMSLSTCENELASHASFMLVKFCYPYEPVRKAADEWISSLVAKFPAILWNRECLSTLLDLLDVIGQAARTKPMDMISIKMPNTGEIIELPDETPARKRLLQEVIELGNLWLKNGAAVAPTEVAEQLQEYMQRFSQLGQNHIGFSLAVEIGSIDSGNNTSGGSILSPNNSRLNDKSSSANISTPSIANSNAATFVSTLQLKALYTGEVNGMINMMMADENENGGDADENEKLIEIVEELAFLRLIEEFEKIREYHKDRKTIDINVFSSIMYRSCAFLINRYSGQSVRLIHMVCYTPAIIFTQESMQVGITAWKWLLAERPDLTRFIMTSISDIWSWTVNQRIGIFSNTKRDDSPLAISASTTTSMDGVTPTPSPAANNKRPTLPSAKALLDKANHLPHKLMIRFLEERFSIVRYSSKEQIDIIAGMLQKAISDPMILSVSPKSLGTRFSLLLLAMRFVQGEHIGDQAMAMLLRQRVYQATLSWFYLPPIWYGLSESSGELESDTRTLIDFCKCLQTESLFASYDKRFTINFRDRTATNADRNVYNTMTGSVGTVSSMTQANGTLRRGSERASIQLAGLATQNAGAAAAAGGGSVIHSSASITNSTSTSFNNNNSSSFTADLLSIRMDVIGSGIGTMSSANSFSLSQSLIDSMKADKQPMSNDLLVEELRKHRNLILLLVGNELERMSAWNNPINRLSQQIPEQLKFSYDNLPKSIKSTWKEYLVSAWKINPRLAIHFSTRFPQTKIRRILSEMVVKNTKSVLNIPEALPLLVTEDNVKSNIPELKYLLYWETVTPPAAIALLGKSYHSHPLVSQYACRVLRNFPPETIMFYIPQLVQALRYDKTGLVEQYLVNASKTSELLAHQIIWNVQTYTEPDPNTGKMIDDPQIQEVAKRLKERIISEMVPGTLENFKKEFNFFESFTSISGSLLQNKDPTKRKGQLKEELRRLSSNHVDDPEHPLYLPTNPKNIVIGLEIESAMTLQSAAKVPILVNFKVLERKIPEAQRPPHPDVKSPPPSDSPPIHHISASTTTSKLPEMLKTQYAALASSSTNLRESSRLKKQHSRRVIQEHGEKPSNTVQIQGCIFKSGDDIRQDMLALQVIDLFKRIFNSVGLDLFLFPYKVIATKPGCGMIELCPNTMSRDQIGKKVNGTLYNYFISKYGHKNSAGFQNARRNFIRSMAAYSVVSYILQIKDRHNANILVDEEGHIIHIDFGFIFDISPGGDLLTFEASPFKMSQEMIDIMGGKPGAEQFTWFMEQSVRAFLAARQHMDSIITLVELMLDTRLPCFKEQTLLHLRNRFCPGRSETYAAKHMTKVVFDSFSAVSTFSTYFYDVFQYYDNGIEM
ncbi:hypothetical protein SAMD00019534_077090 [Acytostelium subglobosum LB1]|uniref:hypothetical protein n=1 Tax=Acytostelium subglobosum LB1 TaxID=1410327 RepID=UPI000644A0A3|nr:hypothetical protein SAMD00019534_077090 [Acytostelium subglobosum LB1]GAM24534.1 hypothetical protein SAMD00019534_077090 [Acytostelium subglobosum LB1]|eukprot:XP_012752860.1 hypothetical protein SAMD00019534_077090 [Acytostelium subglobosum LB1]